MSINQLLHHHQLAQMNAGQARSATDRETYFDLVGYYAKRIGQWRRAQGLTDAGWPGAREQRWNAD